MPRPFCYVFSMQLWREIVEMKRMYLLRYAHILLHIRWLQPPHRWRALLPHYQSAAAKSFSCLPVICLFPNPSVSFRSLLLFRNQLLPLALLQFRFKKPASLAQLCQRTCFALRIGCRMLCLRCARLQVLLAGFTVTFQPLSLFHMQRGFLLQQLMVLVLVIICIFSMIRRS